MSSFFSGYVRSLDPTGAPPSPTAFDDALEKLRKALVYELKKRALWSAPPSYLGIFGGAHWAQGDLLDELLLDCYEFIFIRRLKGLRNQLSIKKNIDGLVFLNIRHFLYETQKRHDPLGFRTFEILQEAILRLLKRDIVYLLEGDPKVRNDTVLGFSPSLDPQLARDIDLSSQIVIWNNELLPELITAWNREPTLKKLQGMIGDLRATDIEVFCFRDLIEPMRDDVRGRWHAIQLDADSETAVERSGAELVSIVQFIRPEHEFEDQQSYRKLADCVAEAIDQQKARRKTLEYLHRLWQFLHAWAAESDPEHRAVNAAEAQQDEDQQHESGPRPNRTGRMPTDVRLGELLRIPRGRIPSLKKTLGDLAKACQEDISGNSAVTTSNEEVSDGNPNLPHPSLASGERRPVVDLKRRREMLRLETGRAAREIPEMRAIDAPDELRSGARLIFAEPDSGSGEWAILQSDSTDSKRVLVAPVDDHPLVGSRDVAAIDGTTIVRCDLATWVDARSLADGRQVGALEDEVIERARLKASEIAAGTLRPGMSEREVDAAPEYLRWIDKLAEARDVLVEKPIPRSRDALSEKRQTKAIPFKRADRRSVWKDYRTAYALAAALSVAVLGLSFWAGHLRTTLSRPILLPVTSSPEVVFRDPDRTLDTLNLTATESHAVIYLILAGDDDDLIFRVELMEKGDDSVLWASEEMVGDSQFLLAVPRRLLTAEDYRLRLYGRDPTGEERFLEEHKVRIELD